MKELLEGTKFELELVKSLLAFVPQQIKDALSNNEIKYEDLGNEKQLKLKKILDYFGNLNHVLEDLDKVLIFLKKDRTTILTEFPELENQEAYFNYHYENYYIRLITISDIIGKLGTLIYNLDLNIKKSNAYVFKEKSKKEGYDKISSITDKLIEKLEHLKPGRHQKLHSGKSDLKPLNGIIIWEDLNELIGSNTSPILEEHTNEQIDSEIDNIKTNITEIIEIIKEFLNESTDELNKYIE